MDWIKGIENEVFTTSIITLVLVFFLVSLLIRKLRKKIKKLEYDMELVDKYVVSLNKQVTTLKDNADSAKLKDTKRDVIYIDNRRYDYKEGANESYSEKEEDSFVSNELYHEIAKDESIAAILRGEIHNEQEKKNKRNNSDEKRENIPTEKKTYRFTDRNGSTTRIGKTYSLEELESKIKY